MNGNPSDYYELLSMLLRLGYKMKVANRLARLIREAELKEKKEEELREVREGIVELLRKHKLEEYWEEDILGER
jgi:hypothetical protein